MPETTGVFFTTECAPKGGKQTVQTPRSPKVSDRQLKAVAPCQRAAVRASIKAELARTVQSDDGAHNAVERRTSQASKSSEEDGCLPMTPSMSRVSTTCSSSAGSPRPLERSDKDALRIKRLTQSPPPSPQLQRRSAVAPCQRANVQAIMKRELAKSGAQSIDVALQQTSEDGSLPTLAGTKQATQLPQSPKVSDKDATCSKRWAQSTPQSPRPQGRLAVAPCQKAKAQALMKRGALQSVDDVRPPAPSRRISQRIPEEHPCLLEKTPSSSSMSTTCSSLINSPRLPEQGHCSNSRQPGSAALGTPSCQQMNVQQQQQSAKAGASRVDGRCSTLDGKNELSMTPVAAMAARRFSALADARISRKQSVASEARSEAFCKDIVAKLGEMTSSDLDLEDNFFRKLGEMTSGEMIPSDKQNPDLEDDFFRKLAQMTSGDHS